MADNQPDLSEAPQELQDAVAEWLEDHPDDVVMVPIDSMDVLILSANADAVVWINPEGEAKRMQSRWITVTQGEEP